MWASSKNSSLRNVMAAWFHFTFYYQHFGRELKFCDRIVDTCLSLQNPEGLFDFGTGAIGQNCLDYDAIDLLVLASRNRNYRSEDVTKCLENTVKALGALENPDGGWANSKWSRKPWFGGRIANRLPGWLRDATTKVVENKANYSVCASFMVAPSIESNPFCSWFRPLSINIAKLYLEGSADNCNFRSLPFLGYHKGLA